MKLKLFLFLLLPLLALRVLGQQALHEQEHEPRIRRQDAVSTNSVSLQTVTFQLAGTPLLGRILEVDETVLPSNLLPQLRAILEGTNLWPNPLPPPYVDPTGVIYLQRTIEARRAQLVLQVMFRFKGLAMQPPSQSFINPKASFMMVRGTPQEIEVIKGMIQVPPGGVVAYMRWLGERVKAESIH